MYSPHSMNYTLAVAESLLESSGNGTHGRATVVFADALMEDEEYGKNRCAAKRMGALCFKRSIGSMDLRPSPNRKYTLMLFGADEYENLRVSLELAGRYEDRSDMELTVLASSKDTELLIDARRKELFNSMRPVITLSCVSDVNAVIYELLDLHPLFGDARSLKAGRYPCYS